tara:strand:+ start:106 stop:552 length:447 start_codon:yes stop_codon:yes gene_type:complete
MKTILTTVFLILIQHLSFSQHYYESVCYGERMFLNKYNIEYEVSKSENCKTIHYPKNFNQILLIDSKETFVSGIKKIKIKRDKIKYIYIVEYWEKLDWDNDGKKDILHDRVIIAEYKKQKLVYIDIIEIEKLLGINTFDSQLPEEFFE